MIKLWLDDLREPPSEGAFLWLKTSQECIAIYDMFAPHISFVSLDHDLGGDDTAQPFADWMLERAVRWGLKPPQYAVHSQNPVGRENLIRTMDRAWTIWREQCQKSLATESHK